MGRSLTNIISSNDESRKSCEIDWDIFSFETLQSNSIVDFLVVGSGRLCEKDYCCGKYEWRGIFKVRSLSNNCFSFNIPSFEIDVLFLLPAVVNIDVPGILLPLMFTLSTLWKSVFVSVTIYFSNTL